MSTKDLSARPRPLKYAAFEKDPTFVRWHTNLARGSPITAEVAVRRLGRVCELLETTPQEMLETAEKDLKGFQDSLEDLVTRLESERKSPGYIVGLLKAVKSWLRYNDVRLTRRIKVSNPKPVWKKLKIRTKKRKKSYKMPNRTPKQEKIIFSLSPNVNCAICFHYPDF